ncbi:MAG: VWA domain-containing protein [Bryobacteraceae bacterium]
MRFWSFFLLIAAMAAQTQTGEVTTREETPTFQSSVSLVRVPVVVRDKQGRALGSFRKEDFQLTDRGKPQEIAQFAIESSAAQPIRAGGARPEAPQAETSAELAAASKPAVPARFVAFVFDDVHLKMEDLVNARKAALQHLEPGIPPQERVALLTLSGSVSLEFTNDVAKFREMLMKIMPVPPRVYFPPASFYLADQFMRSPGDEQATCIFTPPCSVDCSQLMPPVLRMQTEVTIECLPLACQLALEAPDIARETFRSVYNDGASEASNAFRILNNVVRLLGSMPGDRVMILVSPGMYLPDELQRSLAESIDRATRSGVIINTLDARGVYTVDTGAGEASQQCGLSLPQTQVEVAKYNHFAVTAQGLILDDLAHSTGGTAVSDNDLLGGFNRLANPPEYVYYLSFYPRDLKPDGKFHEIKVALANNQGLSIQARRGYWAPAHLEDAATAATREISEAVFSHDELRDLPLGIDTQFYKTTAADARLKVIAHLDTQQLHLRKQDDRNRDDVTVVCALFDGNGNYIKGTQKVVELRVSDANVERRRELGVTTNSDFDVKSGAYMIRVVARDAEGQQMASANDTVEIP